MPQWQIDEIQQCIDDPVYFACKYIKVVHVDKGLVPFALWDFQKDMLNHFHKNRFSIVKTARQVGKSSVTIAYILHTILFTDYQRVAILANKGKTAQEIMSRLQLAYENLPAWMQQGIITWNKGDIELENGSIIIAGATTSSAVRGYSFTLLFMDEFAFVPTNIADEFFTSTYPTVSSGESTKVIIVSTPNGMNHFYFRWMDAVEGKSDFKHFEVHWSAVPGRDERWKRMTLANMSPTQFAQEMEAEFLGSTHTLISATMLKHMLINRKTPILSETFGDQISGHENFKVYENPREGATYAVTVDVSRGQGKDYSAISVIDITGLPYKQVAVFRDNNIDPIQFPTIVYMIAQRYNEAFALVELNDIGQQIAETLHYEFAYENLVKVEAKPKLGQIVSTGHQRRTQLGVKTSTTTKKIGCANLKAMVENGKLEIVDKDTITELTNFTSQMNTYKAEPGSNDDIAMTLVLFGWLVNQRFFKDNIGSDIRKQLQEENLQMSDQMFLSFLYDDGTEDSLLSEDDDGKNQWFAERKNLYPWDDLNFRHDPKLSR